MADDDDNPPEPSRPRTSRSSTAASRAGKRRVTLPSSDSSPTASSKTSSSGGRGRHKTPATPRPFFRRPGFWLLVIVAEAVAALVISYNTPSNLEDVSLEGGDLAQFCERVTVLADLSASGERLQIETAPDFYQRQSDDFRRLAEVAPDSIKEHLNTLAALSDEVKVAAQGIAERKRVDSTYQTAIQDLASKEGEFEGRVGPPQDQIRRVVLAGCGIDLNQPLPPPTTVAPGPVGSAPTSVPGTSTAVPGDGSTEPPTPTTSPPR